MAAEYVIILSRAVIEEMDKEMRVSEKKLSASGYDERVCLDYIKFLSACCKKRWSFVDAIYGVMPIFGMVTRKTSTLSSISSERLKELALQIISTQVSDEINISRLIVLAGQQNIENIEIILPYPLSEQQLLGIRQEYVKPLKITQLDDRLHITLLPLPHREFG